MEEYHVVPSMPATVSLRSVQTWWDFVPYFIIQQCCPPRTLLENGSSAVLAPNGKVSGAYARQVNVNETTFGACFHICNSEPTSHPLLAEPYALHQACLPAPFRMRASALTAPARDPI